MENIIISTQDHIEGYKIIQTFGFVSGSTVRGRGAVRNYFASIRSAFSGEIPEYTKAAAESREQALDRMVDRAKKSGANAILAMRLITTEVTQNCAEIVAYGTAVKLEKD